MQGTPHRAGDREGAGEQNGLRTQRDANAQLAQSLADCVRSKSEGPGLWLIIISAWTPAASVPESRFMHSRTVFFLGLLLAASGVVSPAIALAGGIAFGFTMEHPFRLESHSLAKL